MFKSLIEPPRANKEQQGGDARNKVDVASLKMLIEHFPLGKKLRYTPEFKHEIVLDTIIVGYGVNKHFVYSRDAIECDEDGTPSSFLVDEQKEVLPVSKVRHFFLMVPDTSDQELKLDYHRRAMLGHGQFSKGNAITLITSPSGRGVVTMDTEVARPVVLKDGPYAQAQMILLIPETETLNYVDNRKNSRSPAHVPVAIYPHCEAPAYGCTLIDFSVSTVQLRFEDPQGSTPVMHANEELIIVVDLGAAAKTCTIKGVVLRSSADSCVLRLEQLHKNNQFVSLSPMDLIELKSGLLNYGL